MTTADYYAHASDETRLVVEDLEEMAGHFRDTGMAQHALTITAAIDRLIVLDTGKPAVKESLTPHPRERALHQDTKRGNFRYQQEDDGA